MIIDDDGRRRAGPSPRDAATGARAGAAFTAADQARTASGRIKRLTQAALNVDATLDRVGGVAEDLGASLDDFQRVLGRMDALLERFGGSLDEFAGTIGELNSVVRPLTSDPDGVEELIARVERVVATVDWALTPLTWARAVTGGVPAAAREAAVRLGGIADGATGGAVGRILGLRR